MFSIKSVVAAVLLITVLTADCTAPVTMVPNSFLSSFFSSTLGTINSPTDFRNLLSNPSIDTLTTYVKAQASYILPLWCLAALIPLFLLGCCFQICCYNCCRVRKCGRRINAGSYYPSCVNCSVYLFFIFSFLLIALGVASFILASDIDKTSNTTLCNIQATYNSIYQGVPAGSSPAWSGVNNIQMYANQVATNFPNTIPTINSVLGNAAFTSVIDTSPSSLYTAATTTYACPTALSTQTVTCPFATTSKCPQASATQTPVFSQTFCQANVTTSASAQIAAEQTANSTAWKNNIVSLKSSVSSAAANPPSFTDLTSQAATLSNSILGYRPTLEAGITAGNNNIRNATIGIYSVVSFFIPTGLLAFFSVFCVFCTRNFNCRFMLYPLWICFALLGFIMFLASSVLLFGSFVTFDSCQAYSYYTHNTGAFQTLSYFQSSQISKILNTCFIQNPNGNIFDTFTTTNINTITTIQNQYLGSLPASTFSSVATSIENQLNNYSSNPNIVRLVGDSATTSPQAALNQANQYASNGGSASCNAVNDSLQYNPANCYPYPIGAMAPSPSCMLVNSNSIPVVAGRQASFTSHNCASNFAAYQNNFDSLNQYGNGIQSLAAQYLSDPGLSSYESSFFNYYEAVTTAMNPQVQALFQSFLTPLNQLTQGSSCKFLTQSLNSLVDNSCNTNFPYIYAISILIIGISICLFFLMILAYFLTTRTEFYAHLNGDYSNYDESAGQDKEVGIQMADMSQREQLLK